MLARGDLRKEALLLFVAAADHDRQHAELLHRDDQRARRARLGDLFDDLHVGEERAAEAAVLGGNRNAEQIVLREQLLDVPRELAAGVDLGGARRDFLGDELAHHGEDHRLFVVACDLRSVPSS